MSCGKTTVLLLLASLVPGYEMWTHFTSSSLQRLLTIHRPIFRDEVRRTRRGDFLNLEQAIRTQFMRTEKAPGYLVLCGESYTQDAATQDRCLQISLPPRSAMATAHPHAILPHHDASLIGRDLLYFRNRLNLSEPFTSKEPKQIGLIYYSQLRSLLANV